MQQVSSGEQRMAVAAMFLAVIGSSTVLGLFLGTAGQALWPEVSRGLLQTAAGAVGLGLGWRWWAIVGRRWLEEEEQAVDQQILETSASRKDRRQHANHRDEVLLHHRR